MLDLTKPVRMKGDDRPIRIICTDAEGDFPIVALLKDGKNESPLTFRRDGSWSHPNSKYTLVNKKPSFWFNVYESGNSGSVFKTREEADKIDRCLEKNGSKRVACIEVPWKEGQGL